MNAPRAIEPGSTIEIDYPFVRETRELCGDEGPYDALVWAPGVRFELVYPDDSAAVADGLGAQILTVVDIHKPGRFPTRVFYTRQWRTPDGRAFGKPGLKIATLEKFRRIAKGYEWSFDLTTKAAE